MYKVIIAILNLLFNQFIRVSSFDFPQFYVPTQQQFIAQQTQALLNSNKAPGGINNPSFGWPSFPQTGGQVNNLGGSVGATSSASSNAASGFSFGLGGPNTGVPQFFGGTFGLGFGFGSGWTYPYPVNQYPVISGNIQQQSQVQVQQQQSSASASASTGVQFRPVPIQIQQPAIPVVLRPSNTGWDTSYNVPCGTYKIKPFVVANLRLATGSSPFGKRRKRRSPFRFEYENAGADEEPYSAEQFRQERERSFPSYFPPINQGQVPIQGNREPKTCLWNFNSDGPCKLKFKCVWFQLPALFSCSENYMQVTDATSNLNSTFCGNRKPRKVYNSSSGKLILTFRSQTASLPAVFDCAVTCTLEASPNEQKPQRKVINVPSSWTKEDIFATSTENDETSSSSHTENKKMSATTENHRIRIGDCKCGLQDDHYLSSKGRIVGGTTATPAEFSWTVALVRKPTSVTSVSRSQRPFCSGSLISDRYVITAAHCVSNNKIIREPRSVSVKSPTQLFDVLLIEHDLNRLDEIPGGSVRSPVDKIIVHPLYDNVSFNFDVALIRLERPIELSFQPDYYRYDTFDFHSQRQRFIPEVEARPLLPRPTPICLPTDKETLLEDKYGTITGWGLQHEGGVPSDELMKATVQIFNDSLCKEIYKEYNYPVTESMMCAGFMAGKVDACVGDSGGGLVIKENKRHFLAGITSWGRGCGRKKQPGVYTKVPGLIEWIKAEASDGIWCI